MSRPRRAALLIAGACLLLTGCAPTVALTPAPHATSVGCAGVVVRLPETIGRLEQRNTDAQGTAAWGDPAGITLRCGVEEPVVSGQCYSYGGVDWLRRDASIGGADQVVLDTYGRDPVTEVVIDPLRGGSTNDVLPALSQDVILQATRATGARCRSAAEIPSASPSPTGTAS